jgi:hypothetical protein
MEATLVAEMEANNNYKNTYFIKNYNLIFFIKVYQNNI